MRVIIKSEIFEQYILLYALTCFYAAHYFVMCLRKKKSILIKQRYLKM